MASGTVGVQRHPEAWREGLEALVGYLCSHLPRSVPHTEAPALRVGGTPLATPLHTSHKQAEVTRGEAGISGRKFSSEVPAGRKG